MKDFALFVAGVLGITVGGILSLIYFFLFDMGVLSVIATAPAVVGIFFIVRGYIE